MPNPDNNIKLIVHYHGQPPVELLIVWFGIFVIFMVMICTLSAIIGEEMNKHLRKGVRK